MYFRPLFLPACLACLALGACTTPPAAPAAMTNSLGMSFAEVPVGDEKVLFACVETQRRHMALFTNRPLPSKEEPAWPATHVSWKEASAFCAWLTKLERQRGLISARQRYRLPTDHEWSCAAGIGHLEKADLSPEEKSNALGGMFPWGASWPPPHGAGNLCGRESRHDFPENYIVDYRDALSGGALLCRASSANPRGIHDLSGNVWEWCEDLFRPGTDWRVLRGGSWKSARPQTLLASHRTHDPENYRSDSVGFRCVLVDE
jgi:formylglycine-generating enzyme required for sulfatase activity